jgi:hypothetical protein
MELTVTEAALIDFQNGQAALMARAKNFDPAAFAKGGTVEKPLEPQDLRIPAAHMDALCVPVRVEFTFDDPIATRRQLEAFLGHVHQLMPLTFDTKLGFNRQRLQLRMGLKTAAEQVALISGRTPSKLYRRPRRAAPTSDDSSS